MSLGCVTSMDFNGRTIWIADAHRDDGKRFVVRAHKKLSALLQLESDIRPCRPANWLDSLPRFLSSSASLKPILNQAKGSFPAGSSPLPGPATTESTRRGTERNPNESPDSTQNNNSTASHHNHAPLLRAFTDSASAPAGAVTGWRLSRGQHR
jgi:hypothetical protein